MTTIIEFKLFSIYLIYLIFVIILLNFLIKRVNKFYLNYFVINDVISILSCVNSDTLGKSSC